MNEILKVIITVILFSQFVVAQNSDEPFSVKDDLFDYSQPETLGLTFANGAESFTVYEPGEDGTKYNNGAVVTGFKGMLLMQWQSSLKDEDATDTHILYSISKDMGETWSIPKQLIENKENELTTSGGWWQYGDTLVAYINVWPLDLEPRGGFTEYVISTDGINWSERKPVTTKDGKPLAGIIEQDTRSLPNGRILTAVHAQPGMVVTPYYTDDQRGVSGWQKGNMVNNEHKGTVSREIEPSWYYRNNGKDVVMIFRDQNSSHKVMASVSYDNCKNWTTPVLTNMPDSRSKKSAGNLPEGKIFMVSNPTNDKTRIPLVITLSKDGYYFDEAFLLRAGGDDLQPMRYEGKYKRAGYSYPKSSIYNGYLFVAYSTNKEDIEITRVKLSEL